MIPSVNVNTNLFQRGELKVNACCRFSRQVYNWQLPHVNSSLNMWRKALWQHTFFIVVTDKNLWVLKCSRSAVFSEIHICVIKRKHSLVRIPSIFSNVFVSAPRRRAMKEADTYTTCTRYWLPKVTYHNLDTFLNRQCLIENRISRHVWLITYFKCSHKLPNPELIIKNSKIKAYFDA